MVLFENAERGAVGRDGADRARVDGARDPAFVGVTELV